MLLFERFDYHPKEDLIGKGPASRVYKALDRASGQPIVIKFYRDQPIRETSKMMTLEHPNLCPYLFIDTIEREDSFGEKEVLQVAAMPLCTRTIAESYRQDQNLLQLLDLTKGYLKGLSYLHQQGIIHRRVRQSNLLVRMTGSAAEALITDFGIDHLTGAQDSHFSELVVAVPYMAPEQFNPQKYGAVSPNIDLWGLGVTIYEVLTGDVLFVNRSDDSRQQVMQNILMPRLPEKAKQLPYPFNELVARCLVKQVSKRAATAEELLRLLEEKEEENTDDTVVLPKETIALETAADDTILLPKPTAVTDDTVLLPKAAPSDDTMVLSATGKLVVNSGDDTVILPLHKDKDDTMILSRDRLPSEKTDRETQNVLFNRYEYNASSGLIGKGGFSRVYKAYDKKLNRQVALKIYKTGDFSDRYSPIAEIRRVVNLDHPNICRYLDIEEMEKENAFGEREMTHICVMELLDGGNLLDYYNRHRTESVLKKLVGDILNGLSYLHKNGIIHRDIKPANILIKETLDGPVAKITDFGISKVSDSVNSNSSSALVVSIPYMAPEQLNVKKYGIDQKISYNLDLWSLGVTIYEVVTGNVLFKNNEQDSSEQIMTNIMAPELPEKINALPQPFKDIVSYCIVKDARQRVQRAEDLQILLEGGKLSPIPVAKTSDQESTQTRKIRFATEEEKVKRPVVGHERSGLVKIAIVAGLVVLCMGIYIYIQNRRLKETVSFAADSPKAPAAASAPAASNLPPAATAAGSSERKTANPAAAATPANTNNTANAANTVGAAAGASPTKHSEKPHPSHDNPTSADAAPKKYVLLLSTPQTCSVSLNGINYGLLETGKTMKVYLMPGNYVLQATGAGNSSASYTGKLVVQEENLNQVGEYRIPL